LVDAETAEDVFFRAVAEAAAQLRQGFARSVGMSPQRVQILVRLRRGGETSHSDLRQALGVDGATITRLVKELERDGLVGRRTDPADNRYTLAALTESGDRHAADLERRHQAYQEGLLRGVSTRHQEQVLDTLRRLRANLTREDAP
jgi:MarR family transcriptional regulator for hemolysin